MLELEQLAEIEEQLLPIIEDSLLQVLTYLNRQDRLDELLSLFNASFLMESGTKYTPFKDGRIVIIGQSSISADQIRLVAGKCGIDKSRLELHLEYEEAVNLNVQRMQWSPLYSLILVGPIPHSAEGKGNKGNLISAIENTEGYPPVIRLCAGEQLKITKAGLQSALQEAKSRGIIS